MKVKQHMLNEANNKLTKKSRLATYSLCLFSSLFLCTNLAQAADKAVYCQLEFGQGSQKYIEAIYNNKEGAYAIDAAPNELKIVTNNYNITGAVANFTDPAYHIDFTNIGAPAGKWTIATDSKIAGKPITSINYCNETIIENDQQMQATKDDIAYIRSAYWGQ